MAAYYNDNDPFNVRWLRRLVDRGLIAWGYVDDRPIEQVQPGDLVDFRQCHFFAGIGGWSFALRLAGWPDDRPVWTGSCPCQPFSRMGRQGGGDDERHLWPHWLRLIDERRPHAVFGEQTATAIGWGWIDRISADLETLDYAFGSAVLGAHSVGAPHVRARAYWVGDADGARLEGRPLPGRRAREFDPVATGLADAWAVQPERLDDGTRRRVAPDVLPLADGLQRGRVGILRGAGNAIVPQVAAVFIASWLDIDASRDVGNELGLPAGAVRSARRRSVHRSALVGATSPAS